ncbi:hypothetical protein MHK_003081 [Candidatus Magnetomorum sp. HK-1]|nr:hypothetical protein MHK_003081 [Candidatus Magnetomorum sp. HK-1]
MRTQQMLPKDMLYFINQWCSKEIELFVDQVLLIRAQKKSPGFSYQETDLLQRINEGIPFDLQQKYNKLISKRENSTLTEKEYDDLLSLIDKIEKMDAQRIAYLSQLAKIRKTTLPQIMLDLGIKEPEIL